MEFRMKQISVIVTCRGRLDIIKETIKQTLALPDTQYTLVDYDCPDKSGDWVESNFKQARVVRVKNKPYFNLSDARNQGALNSTEPWLLFFDADTAPYPDFNMVLAGRQQGCFYKVDHSNMPAAACLNGVCLVARSGWEQVGGYDSVISGWAPEDVDFNDMLTASGLRPMLFAPQILFHIPHEEKRRTEHYAEADRQKSQLVGWLYISVKRDVSKIWGTAIPAKWRETLRKMAEKCIADSFERGKFYPIELDLGMCAGWPTGTLERKLVYTVKSIVLKKKEELLDERKHREPPA
jgi:hypothetical protein